MTFTSVAAAHSRIRVAIVFSLLLGSLMAQRVPVNPNLRRPPASTTTTTPDATFQPQFVSGTVMLEGVGAPGEPVAVERVCGDATRLLGYTDSKGKFQFPLSNPGFQDASENDPRTGRPSAPQATTSAQRRRALDQTACELRAVLSGFQSSRVLMRGEGNSWEFNAGTIVLKRMEGVQGATVSLTSLNAPRNAMNAYEKALRAVSEQKLQEAETELVKAVGIYPQFAAAWTVLGDIHSQKNQLAQAREEYSRALAADPQFVSPCMKLALLAVQEGKWEEVRQFTEQAERMNVSAYPSAYFYNAAANFNLHRFEAAEESARKFKSLDTEHRHPDVLLLLSMLLERRLDYPGAAQQLREYLAAVPAAPGAQQLREKAQRLESLNVAEQVHDPQ
jgi:tetratricopeptide (TPR) repeat protein